MTITHAHSAGLEKIILKYKNKGEKMKENYMVCNCAQVDYHSIATAVETHDKLENVLDVFKDVQNVTHCTTGCGGCYQKVLDIISEVLMG